MVTIYYVEYNDENCTMRTIDEKDFNKYISAEKIKQIQRYKSAQSLLNYDEYMVLILNSSNNKRNQICLIAYSREQVKYSEYNFIIPDFIDQIADPTTNICINAKKLIIDTVKPVDICLHDAFITNYIDNTAYKNMSQTMNIKSDIIVDTQKIERRDIIGRGIVGYEHNSAIIDKSIIEDSIDCHEMFNSQAVSIGKTDKGIQLSGIDFQNIKDAYRMFYGCAINTDSLEDNSILDINKLGFRDLEIAVELFQKINNFKENHYMIKVFWDTTELKNLKNLIGCFDGSEIISKLDINLGDIHKRGLDCRDLIKKCRGLQELTIHCSGINMQEMMEMLDRGYKGHVLRTVDLQDVKLTNEEVRYDQIVWIYLAGAKLIISHDSNWNIEYLDRLVADGSLGSWEYK